MDTVRPDTDLVRTYLKEIGRVPLLAKEQEITLGKTVQQLAGLEALKAKLLDSLDHEPTVDEWATAAGMTVSALNITLKKGQ